MYISYVTVELCKMAVNNNVSYENNTNDEITAETNAIIVENVAITPKSMPKHLITMPQHRKLCYKPRKLFHNTPKRWPNARK